MTADDPTCDVPQPQVQGVPEGGEALKPCPFCDNEAWIDGVHTGRKITHYVVVCSNCHVTGPGEWPTEARAIKAWNRRAGPSVSQPLPEAVPSAQQSVSMPISEDVHRKEEKLCTPGELEGNGLLGECEYETDRQVYLVEDSERHWYVARSFSGAMKAHESLMEPEADEYTITKMQPERPLSVHMESESDGKNRPDGSQFKHPGLECGYYTVTATASQWATYYTEPRQICSSVFP